MHILFLTRAFLKKSVYMANNRYCIDLAKRGTAACKECKQKVDKGLPRIGKIIPNPFTDAGGDMKQWFHVRCAFIKLTRAKAATKKIDSTDDLEGFDDMSDEHKDEVMKCISEFVMMAPAKTPKKETKRKRSNSPNRKKSPARSPSPTSSAKSYSGKDNSFREFRRLVAQISGESSYLGKTEIIRKFFDKGTDGKKFKGDLLLWVQMLLPAVNKKVYNLQDKQLVKLFSQIFDADRDEMFADLDQAETIAETIQAFFETSETFPAAKKSILTLQQVDQYLDELTKTTKEDAQKNLLEKIAKRCTTNDLKVFILLIKHDLRMGVSGPKHVLDAIHPSAHAAFQASRNLSNVINKTSKLKESGNTGKALRIDATLLTPVLPMLAAPCKKLDAAFTKCPNGMFVEIKYDGERVQIHKKGSQFMYFSRSLKPVLPHKILHFKDYIPKAFPHGDNLILDSEILLVNNKTGKPLPFGTLGSHKQKNFKDANVCLFVFDCMQFNEDSLMKTPLHERRKILEENMKPIKNHVMLSELTVVKGPDHLKKMMQSVCKQGLEGLIVKGKDSVYEPGKRHWLKIKKDHLKEGVMADTADLIVLGADYGSGKWAGKMSIFLMGCLDEKSGKYCTVTKVHTGFTEPELKKVQKELKMKKIGKDPSKVPSWLNIHRSLIPDFVAVDPEQSEVWEITGAEFSKAEVHTADGISIRFPRVTKRRDKEPEDADTLQRLKSLYKTSKETTDLIGLKISPSSSPSSSSIRKRERSSSSSSSERDTKKKRSSSPEKFDPDETLVDEDEEDQQDSVTDTKSPQKMDTKSPQKMSSNLPDIFTGIKIFLPPTLENVDALKRYFISYNGIILKDHELHEVTYAISADSKLDSKYKYPKNIQYIKEKWLWDCIKLQKRIPIHHYV